MHIPPWLWFSFLHSSRQGNWDRVLRRYYTQSRRVRSTTLLTQWKEHLVEFPTNSQSILDYVSFYIANMEFCIQLFEYLKKEGPLHEDIQILLYETLLLKPFPSEPSLRDFVTNQTGLHFRGEDGFEAPNGYIKGLQALTMYKFDSSIASEFIAPIFAKAALESPIFATYGLPVLAASPCHRQLAFDATEQMEDSRILRIRALIERLENGDDKAIRVLLGLLQPKGTKYPARFITNPRALPLLSIALRSPETDAHKQLCKANERFVQKIVNIEDSALIDCVSLEHSSPKSTLTVSCLTT